MPKADTFGDPPLTFSGPSSVASRAARMAPSEQQRGVGREAGRRRREENAAWTLSTLLDLRVEGICYVGNWASSIPHSRQPKTRKGQGFYTLVLELKPRLTSFLLLLLAGGNPAGITTGSCAITGSRGGLVDPLLAPRLVVAVGGDVGAHLLKVELGSPGPVLGKGCVILGVASLGHPLYARALVGVVSRARDAKALISLPALGLLLRLLLYNATNGHGWYGDCQHQRSRECRLE